MSRNQSVLRAAVIGCGRGGRLSLDGLRASNHFEAVAVCDVSARVRQDVARQYPQVRLFADPDDLMSACAVDVVCISSPAPTHASIARSALTGGVCGMLLEKPLACSVAEAERLLREIKDRDVPVVVPHGMLVLPAPMAVKRRIQQGDIGAVERVEVHNAVDLLNAGIHWLVYLLDLFDGDPVAEVVSELEVGDRVVNDGVQVESRGRTRLTMKSGARVVLHSGARTRPGSDVLPEKEQIGAIFRVYGSDGNTEFSAWAGSYWIATAADRGGELIRCAAAGAATYHQVYLEHLARQMSTSRTDYRVVELSLAALRIIETAYACYGGNDWVPGIPVDCSGRERVRQ